MSGPPPNSQYPFNPNGKFNGLPGQSNHGAMGPPPTMGAVPSSYNGSYQYSSMTQGPPGPPQMMRPPMSAAHSGPPLPGQTPPMMTRPPMGNTLPSTGMPPGGVMPPMGNMPPMAGIPLGVRHPIPGQPESPQIDGSRNPAMNRVPSQNELLPAPYHGKGIYAHTTHVGPPHSQSITPTNSEPASRNSSRVPSPIPNQQFDALEGQFRTNTPTSSLNTPPSGSPVSPRVRPSYPGQVPSPGTPPPTSQYNGPPQMTSNMQRPPLPGQSNFTPGLPPMSGQPPRMPPASQYGQTVPPPSGPPLPGQSPQGPPFPGQQMPGLPQPGLPQPGPPQPGQAYGASPYAPPGQQPTMSGNPAMYGMTNQFGGMALQPQPLERRIFNLLQERNILPAEAVKPPTPKLQEHQQKANCSPDVFRCTLNAIPQTNNLLQKARLPLGILIHPFKDLSELHLWGGSDSSARQSDTPTDHSYASSCSSDVVDNMDDSDTTTISSTNSPVTNAYLFEKLIHTHLPVIQSSVIVRCRSCRTYINPFVQFIDQRRWRCNLCYRANELPEEFNFDPVTKSYGSPERRPEIKSSTIEFVAPSEYMLRPPQPAVYLFLLDVSYNALQTGYLQTFCEVLAEDLDKLPGDSRTMVGFITYNSSVHFYNLSEDLSVPQIQVVSDVDDIFLPLPDGLLVNLAQSKELVETLLEQLPTYHQDEFSRDENSAMGAAMQAGLKLLSATGGRLTVIQTALPNIGPGKLTCREDPNQRASNKPANLQPATDFYKLMSLEAAGQQIAIDMFMLNQQYADHATIGGAARHSGGCIYTYPGLHIMHNPSEVERFEGDLRRYITRKIGLEAVMRVRCTRGLAIHSFHGNFFVRSTDLLSLPNINPDAGFGMQMSIEENLTDSQIACMQAALLYTSSKGERRIRVHTLGLPITTSLEEVINSADQQAVACLLGKMAVDRGINSAISDAREALVNACVDALGAFGNTQSNQSRIGALPAPYSLRLLPLYTLALLKHPSMRLGVSTKCDERVDHMDYLKALPVTRLMQQLVPDLYPVHALTDEGAINRDDQVIPQPPRLSLCSSNIDRHGAFILDTGLYLYMWIGSNISPTFCEEVFDCSDFISIPDGLCELKELENETSERLRTFIGHLQDGRPNYPPLVLVREDSRNRGVFMQHMIEDKTESSMSYYEFLQHLQKQLKT